MFDSAVASSPDGMAAAPTSCHVPTEAAVSARVAPSVSSPDAAGSAPAPTLPAPSVEDLAGLVAALAGVDGAGVPDTVLIDLLDGLERVKAACAAAQARVTAAFVASQARTAQQFHARARECSEAGDFAGWQAARDAARRAEFDPPALTRTAARRSRSASARSASARSASSRSASSRAGRSGVAAQVGLARRESPARAARTVSVALALVERLPHTLAALTAGTISERRAELVVRGAAHLDPGVQGVLDEQVIGAAGTAAGSWGDRELEHRVRACADRLDAAAAVERARTAQTERRVTIRPIPDTMAVVSAVLPVAQAVALHACLTVAAAEAKAAGDPRTKGQVMADTLVTRGTGQHHPDAVPVEVQLVITDRALLAGADTPAHIPGYGPVPAGWARTLLTGDLEGDLHPEDPTDADLADQADHLPSGVATDATRQGRPSRPGEPGPGPRRPSAQGPPVHPTGSRRAKVWLRRLYTHPDTGTLVAMDSRRRRFDAGLRRYLIARDGTCRTPWCDAPIRHADHIHPHAAGGPTTDTNGQGLCIRCNLTKEHPGFTHHVTDPGPTRGSRHPHTVQITTPTGHTHTSTAPPVLLALAPPPQLSALEQALQLALAA